jgi:queuosine precursor transporter
MKTLTPRQIIIFVSLLTLHTGLLVASNAAGSKMIGLPFGLAASATVFSYALTFLILDAIAELFGREYSKLTINVGLGAVFMSVIFFSIAIAAPSADFWKNQEAYETVLGSAWRILLGGSVAYLVGQHLDVWSFFKFKDSQFGGKYLWWRSLASTAFSQFFDTIIFITISFAGLFPIMPAIAGQYAIKLILAIVTTPAIYLLVRWARKTVSDDEITS